MDKIYNLMDVVRNGSAPPPCDQTLGIEIVIAESGVAKGVWQVNDPFINGNGVVMGGFLSAVADTMMAYAIASCLEDGRGFASINLHTTFHRPAFKGVVEIEARVERLGRNIAYAVASLVQEGKEVATTSSSVMIQQK